jgi:N-acetylneuraminate synthase/N,N'-diacetyllegionaminate synthase
MFIADSDFNKCFKIRGKVIGDNHPCFIIAEAGVSHFGSIEKAFRLIDAAVNAKADAVKFQIFKTEEMISSECPEWFNRMKLKELPLSAFMEIRDYCNEKDIIFFASAHDLKSLDEMIKLELPCIKIGSGEVQNLDYYRIAASYGKPIILSTGMFLKEDIYTILDILFEAGCRDLALMHCVTEYPTHPKDVNLRMIQTLKKIFPGPVGYSDHTATPDIAASSVLLGANLIEKHITIEKDIPNAQDWKVACTPEELIEFVESVRRLELALGDGEFKLTEGEKRSLLWARKSIVAARDIKKGEIIGKNDVVFKRPGSGISPNKINYVIGKKALQDIKFDTIIKEEMLSEE